jgi:hypothetical protein
MATNKHGIPDWLAAALALDDYDRGDCFASASELALPTRIAALKRLHSAEVEAREDVADRLHMFFGIVMHRIASDHAGANVLHEERLFMDFPGEGRMSGALDHYTLDNGGTLTDWKGTTVWSLIGRLKIEWEAQVNIYAMLLRAHGFEVKAAKLGLYLRDWNMPEADRKPDFPVVQWGERPVVLWADEDVRAYVVMKMRALRLALSGGPLPLCNKEERWAKEDTWAAMKKGRRSAVRVCASEAEAAVHVKDIGTGGYVEHRPGESTRCKMFRRVGKGYCNVVPWCDFGKAQQSGPDKEEEG